MHCPECASLEVSFYYHVMGCRAVPDPHRCYRCRRPSCLHRWHEALDLLPRAA